MTDAPTVYDLEGYGLCERTIFALHNAGILYLDDLRRTPDALLWRIPNVSHSTTRQIRAAVANYLAGRAQPIPGVPTPEEIAKRAWEIRVGIVRIVTASAPGSERVRACDSRG